jgi:ribosomal protein S7
MEGALLEAYSQLRPHGPNKVRNIGIPTFMAKADSKSEHRAIIPYRELMQAAMATAHKEMPRRLDEELGK